MLLVSALELGLVGLVWPFCGALCRVFLASTGLLEEFLVAKGVSEEIPAAVGGAVRQPHGLPPPQNAGLMRGSESLPRAHRPYSPHSLPQPAYGDLGPLAYGREEAESKKLNALNFWLIPGDSASI